MKFRWLWGLIFAAFLAALVTFNGVFSNKTPRQLANLVCHDFVKFYGVVPRFSESNGGAVCSEHRSPSGGPYPICSSLQAIPESSKDLERDIQQLFRSPLASSDPEILRLKAFSKLRWGQRTEDRDQAIDLLSLALDLQPSSARLHNDLSATLLLRGSLDEKPEDLIKALHHANTALQVDPKLAEARANVALALEGLALPREAAGIWQSLLEHPGIGALANAFLNQPSLSNDSGPRLEDLWSSGQRTLGHWTTLHQAGDFEASGRELAYAEEVAVSLAAKGDHLLQDAIELIQRSLQSESAENTSVLLSSHAAFAQLQSSQAACSPDLDKVVEDLGQAKTPFHAWGLIELAICSYYSRDLAQADALLAEAAERWSSPDYPYLVGRLHWLQGLVSMRRGHFSNASSHYAEAVSVYEALNEKGSVSYLHFLEATNYELLGNFERAWEKRLPALHRRFDIGDAVRIHTVVEETTRAVERQFGPALATYFLNEQVRAAQDAHGSASKSEEVLDLTAYSLLDRAANHASMGDSIRALQDLQEAEDLWKQLPITHPSRQRLQYDLDVARCRYSGSDFAAFDAALAFYGDSQRSAGDLGNLLDLYTWRAQLREHMGDSAGAIHDLQEALDRIEALRWEVLDAPQRARYLAKMGDLTESLARILIASSRSDQALLAVERAENRLLLDAVLKERHPTFDFTVNDLLQGIPKSSAVLRYGRSGDQLLMWTIYEDVIRFESRNIARSRLREFTRKFREAILRKRDKEDIEELGSHLATYLLPENLKSLPMQTSLSIIPHHELFDFPFAALVDENQYLIEKYPISYTPSLTFMTRAIAVPPSGHGAMSVLIVADPSIAPQHFPSLQALPSARRGADALRDLYPNSATVLTGAEATLARVLDNLTGARVFSFAGHTVPSSPTGERGLVLAPDGGSGIPILSRESLSSVDLRHLELVLLAACSTGPQTYPESSEMTGLVAAFLARGASGVMSTLWEVDDEGAEAFSLEFHRQWRYLRQGDGALRATQLVLLQQENASLASPAVWAAFQLHRGKPQACPSKMVDSVPGRSEPLS